MTCETALRRCEKLTSGWKILLTVWKPGMVVCHCFAVNFYESPLLYLIFMSALLWLTFKNFLLFFSLFLRVSSSIVAYFFESPPLVLSLKLLQSWILWFNFHASCLGRKNFSLEPPRCQLSSGRKSTTRSRRIIPRSLRRQTRRFTSQMSATGKIQ
jgi:hypothetical protein